MFETFANVVARGEHSDMQWHREQIAARLAAVHMQKGSPLQKCHFTQSAATASLAHKHLSRPARSTVCSPQDLRHRPLA